jgi:cation transport regulator
MATKEATYTVLERLPKRAQEIYEDAFSIAYDEIEDAETLEGELEREEAAHKVAWAAVKKEYERSVNGKWHKRKRT